MGDRGAGRAWKAVFGLAGLLTLSSGGTVWAAPDQPNSDVIAKGKYLVDMGDCAACHTAPNGQKFAGGLKMETPFGPIATPNITPDKETGIGNYTDDQFVRLFHEGIGKGGDHIYPVMPYPWFTKVTRDDVLAIKAYLFSLAPINAPRQQSDLAFPFNIRAGLAAWNEVFLKQGEFKPDPSKSEEINRGAYIVNGLGHCGECHNGRNLLGDTAMAQSLRGGPIENWYAPNITSDVHDGVGKYPDDDIFKYLKYGVSPSMGVVAGPMAQTVHESLSKMTDGDLHAIVAYLKSTPPEPSYISAERSDYKGPQPAGREVYLTNCSSCHQLDGKGVGDSVPALAGNGSVLAAGPQDIIRVILGGIEAQQTYAPMPAVAAGMTDQQIADVTNYIRQAWGNQAPPNAGPGMVAKLRTQPDTYNAMSIGPGQRCATVVQPDIAPVINDPKSGITDALRAMSLENVLQTAHTVVEKVKQAAPHAHQADIVNSLTIAYCPIIMQDAKVPENQKIEQLDNFSERVYSEVKTGGRE